MTTQNPTAPLPGVPKNPKVSVLMPAYCQAEYVAEALESLLAQTYQNWEVAVVDDGSPDRVAEIVAPYAARDPRIRFHHTTNHGLPGARNNAARLTDGPLILPLDADDLLHPDYIAACVREFEADPAVALVYSQWEHFGASTKTPPIAYAGYRKLLLNNTIFCSAMYRRSDFERIGGYDEQIPYGFEDWEMWIRLLDPTQCKSKDGDGALERKVVQIGRRLFRYRIKERSMTTDLHNRERIAATRRYIFGKHIDKYLAQWPDLLGELQDLDYLRGRMARWPRRSLFSRLWYALTGRRP